MTRELDLAWLEGHLDAHFGKKFRWGRRDCTTMVAAWMDRVSGTGWLEAVTGKYRDARTALAFQREFMPAHVALEESGWREVRAWPMAGDIITVPVMGFHGGHLVHGGVIYTMTPMMGFHGRNAAHFDWGHDGLRTWRAT